MQSASPSGERALPNAWWAFHGAKDARRQSPHACGVEGRFPAVGCRAPRRTRRRHESGRGIGRENRAPYNQGDIENADADFGRLLPFSAPKPVRVILANPPHCFRCDPVRLGVIEVGPKHLHGTGRGPEAVMRLALKDASCMAVGSSCGTVEDEGRFEGRHAGMFAFCSR